MHLDPANLLQGVAHLNHAALKIQASQVIYFDPYEISTRFHDADLIFITHSHSDHLSPKDIVAVMKPETVLVVPSDAVEKVKNLGVSNVIPVTPGSDYIVNGISFQTVPAYNINKRFHPRENAWIGFMVTLNNYRYYIAGDTDCIPEMRQIHPDVAFLPVGGAYTMNPQEAAQAAAILKPTVAIPIHYGKVVGSLEDAEKFITLLKPEIEGVILLGK